VEGGSLLPGLDDELRALLRADLVEGGAGDLGPGFRLADVGPVGGVRDRCGRLACGFARPFGMAPGRAARRDRGGGAGGAQERGFAQQVLVVADEERAADLEDLGADGGLQADLGPDAEGIAGGDREDGFQRGAPRR